MGRWKEFFEEFINEENERQLRIEEDSTADHIVAKIIKGAVSKSLKVKKSGKSVCPEGIPVEVWKCLGEVSVALLTRLFNHIL